MTSQSDTATIVAAAGEPASASRPDPSATGAKVSAREPARHFKQLVSFRVNMLASTWSRLAAEANQRDFDLDPREWRILGMLGAYAPMSLLELAREVNVDKSQASRTVSGMIERGLLQRASHETDGRGVQLSLTTQGKTLYKKVFPRAVKRNEELLSVLSDEERAVLDRALDLLTAHAHRTLSRSRTKSAAPKKAGSNVVADNSRASRRGVE